MTETEIPYRREDRKLTLVGAGPGDPELITLKGVNAIRKAGVVLFDALVSKEILALIPPLTPSFSVGKRAGEHSYPQEKINELIVEMGHTFGHVVRLKGGDPFVFGRGMEEIAFAEANGMETAVIPGVTSAIAVPSGLNIPVTSRGVSESFWVVTATTRSGALSRDLELAVQSTATIVVLMGMRRLPEIVDLFLKHGRADTPMAVIQNGTMKNERSVTGTVSGIVSLVGNHDLDTPGIIIAGEVVRFAREPRKLLEGAIINNYE